LNIVLGNLLQYNDDDFSFAVFISKKSNEKLLLKLAQCGLMFDLENNIIL
jgi:hypothetical protein